MFEGWKNPFTKRAEEAKTPIEAKDTPSAQTVQTEQTEESPITIDDIKKAKETLKDLANERAVAKAGVRKTAEELKQLGVNEFEENSNKRTQAFKEVITPFEEQVRKVAQEITETREKFGLKPTKETVLERRAERLNNMKTELENAFYRTELGKKVFTLLEHKNKLIEERVSRTKNNGGQDMKRLESFMRDSVKEETSINDELTHLRDENKSYRDYLDAQDKIRRLLVDIDHTQRADRAR